MTRLLSIIAALGLALTPALAQDSNPEPTEPKAEKEDVEVIKLPDGEIRIIRGADGKVVIERNGERIEGEAAPAEEGDKARDEDIRKRIEDLRKRIEGEDPFKDVEDILKKLKESDPWKDAERELPDLDDEQVRKALEDAQKWMEEFRKQHEERFKEMRERFERMRKQAEEGLPGEWEKSKDDPDTEVIEKEYTSPDGSTKIKVKIVRSVSRSEKSESEEKSDESKSEESSETPKTAPQPKKAQEQDF